MKTLFVLGALLTLSAPVMASELDQPVAPPGAVLVREDAQGQATVYRAASALPKGASAAQVQAAIVAAAKPENQVAQVQKTTSSSELDRDSSTAAWHWHGYGNYYYNPGSYFSYYPSYNYGYNYGYNGGYNYGYPGYNYGYNNYYNYNYNYSYAYAGCNWHWYW